MTEAYLKEKENKQKTKQKQNQKTSLTKHSV